MTKTPVDHGILRHLEALKASGKKGFAVLIDPDKVTQPSQLIKSINMAVENQVSFFFVGGSLQMRDNFGETIGLIKDHTEVPVVLFPGSNMQIDLHVDGLLFLALISGRNPEFLIGQHVVVAPLLKRSQVEVIPTGYCIIESGKMTSVEYMSNTVPIPADKPSLAASTAMAGEMLGHRLIYLDAGSGALNPVSARMINMVRRSINTPLIVGGGINSAQKANDALQAGADLIVIGNGIEENPDLLISIGEKISMINASLNVH